MKSLKKSSGWLLLQTSCIVSIAYSSKLPTFPRTLKLYAPRNCQNDHIGWLLRPQCLVRDMHSTSCTFHWLQGCLGIPCRRLHMCILQHSSMPRDVGSTASVLTSLRGSFPGFLVNRDKISQDETQHVNQNMIRSERAPIFMGISTLPTCCNTNGHAGDFSKSYSPIYQSQRV